MKVRVYHPPSRETAGGKAPTDQPGHNTGQRVGPAEGGSGPGPVEPDATGLSQGRGEIIAMKDQSADGIKGLFSTESGSRRGGCDMGCHTEENKFALCCCKARDTEHRTTRGWHSGHHQPLPALSPAPHQHPTPRPSPPFAGSGVPTPRSLPTPPHRFPHAGGVWGGLTLLGAVPPPGSG